VAKRDRTPGAYMDYLNTAEAEYCKLYRAGKWKNQSPIRIQRSTFQFLMLTRAVAGEGVDTDGDEEDPNKEDVDVYEEDN